MNPATQGSALTDGLQAFCRFLAQWSSATLVLALEGTRDTSTALVIASNQALEQRSIDIPSVWHLALGPGLLRRLEDAALRLPSALQVHLGFDPRSWHFLPGGLPGAEGSGVLLIGARENLDATEPELLQSLVDIFRQMLSDHRQLRQRRYFAAKFQDLFDSVPSGIVLIEGDGLSGHVNRSAAELLDCAVGVAEVGQIAAAMRRLRERCDNAAELRTALAELTHDLQFSLRLDWRVDGRILSVDTHPVLGDGRQGRIWIFEDVTELRRREAELRELAQHDPLTGAFNRQFLQAEGGNLVQAVRGRGSHPAVLILDIDHFKDVNDRYGHDIGDAVLRAVVERLQARLRRRDGGTLLRWGGEEFVVLSPATGVEAAQLLAERLRQGIAQQSVQIQDLSLAITISLGGTLFREGEDLVRDTIPRADRALYRAKAEGRNRWMWI